MAGTPLAPASGARYSSLSSYLNDLSGIGAFFNVLNFGQMLLWHVVLLPLAVAFLIGVHILQVRRRGVVPPLPVKGDGE